MPGSNTQTPRFLALWLFVCAYLNCAGWLLSSLHALNAVGYAALLIPGLVAGVVWWMRTSPPKSPCPLGYRAKQRFRKLFPATFLVLLFLELIGGLLYYPTNFDGLAYRVQRVLYWLSEGHWEWVHTYFHRLNTRSCGWEWLATPIMVFTHTDRYLFIIDFLSFLLLPGLFFSLLLRLGVARRAAWYWMWLLPAGYGYLLQAGSIGNDLFGAIFSMAALDLGLRARAAKSLPQLWLSMLAVALLTGSKASNIPLGLPWFIAVLPILPLLVRRMVTTAGVATVCIAVSFVPMAALNYLNCKDWTGQAAEHATIGHGDALLHVGHNSIELILENLVPPVFPFASAWNRLMIRIIPPTLQVALAKTFDTGAAELRLPDMQVEEVAGLGFGLSLMLVVSLAYSLRKDGWRAFYPTRWKGFGVWIMLIIAGAWISILPFLIKSAWAATARLSAPYYGLMVPLFLLGASQSQLVRQKWWRGMAWLTFPLAGLLILISPARPLLPMLSIIRHFKTTESSRLWQRAETVYSVYAERPHAFAPALAALGPNPGLVGLVTWDDPEATLWRPFVHQKFRHVVQGDTRADMDRLGIRYLLVAGDKFPQCITDPMDQWLEHLQGRIIRKIPLTLRVEFGSVNWYLIELTGAQIVRPSDLNQAATRQTNGLKPRVDGPPQP